VIVCFIDFGGIVEHHCLSSLFIIIIGFERRETRPVPLVEQKLLTIHEFSFGFVVGLLLLNL